jgi:flagellar basal-body rod modification protein FlgD
MEISAIAPYVEPVDNETTGQITGQDDFLNLFLAQMKHQDPLNPMDSHEFTAQLAQFSSLEQLFNINEHLESIINANKQSMQYQAINLIGKEVVLGGDVLSLEAGKSATGRFSLESVAHVGAVIYDETGQPVRDLELGELSPGYHDFSWDGKDNDGRMLEPGIYGFEVLAESGDGLIMPVRTQVVGEVTRVNLEEASPVLFVGDLPVSISQLIDIRSSGGSAESHDDGSSEGEGV